MNTIRFQFARKSLLAAVCLALLTAACALAFAQSSTKPITRSGLEDAIKIGGLQDSELIGIIQKRGVDFVLTPQIREELRGLGASPGVLQAVAANYRGPAPANVNPVAPSASSVPASPPADRTPAPATPSYPSVPGIYLQQGGAWTRLQQESVGWRKEGLMKGLKKFSGGLINAEATGEVPGAHSATSAHAPLSLLIRPEDGLSIEDYLIIHLHGKRDDRQFKISLGQLHSEDQVDFRVAKVDNNLYEVNFSQGQGDYAFITRRDVPAGSNAKDSFLFTFQIVP